MPQVCCICGTNTCDTYYPTTCLCAALGKHDSKDVAIHFRSLFLKSQSKHYFEGLCLGCWTRMFNPRYVKMQNEVYIHNNGKFEKVEEHVYTQKKAAPKCEFCGVPYAFSKNMDYVERLELRDESTV